MLLDVARLEVAARVDVHDEERAKRPRVDRAVRGGEHAYPGDAPFVLERLDAELRDLGLHLIEVRLAEQAHSKNVDQLAEHGLDVLRVAEQRSSPPTKHLHMTTLRHFRDLQVT